nr:hypothetical protein [uncultured Methanosphaera sp.]
MLISQQIYTNDKTYQKAEATQNITVNKTPIKTSTIAEIETQLGSNTTLNFKVFDIYNNPVEGNSKVVIKINNKTQLTTTITDGIANITINTQDMKCGNYTMDVLISENNIYAQKNCKIPLEII